MNNSFKSVLKTGTVPEYIKRIICCMPEDIFIPMCFEQTEDRETIVYDLSNYIPFKDICDSIDTFSVYDYLEKLVAACVKAAQYMIMPFQMEINISTVYVNVKIEGENMAFLPNLRILYVPVEGIGKNRGDLLETGHFESEFPNTINSKIKDILNEIATQNTNSNLQSYIKSTVKKLNANCSLSELYAHIIKVKREVKICGLE